MAYQRGSGRVGRLRHSELTETARAAHFARSIGRHSDKVVECSRDALLIGAKLCVLPVPLPEPWRPCLERHLKLQIQDLNRARAKSGRAERKERGLRTENRGSLVDPFLECRRRGGNSSFFTP